MLSSIPQLDISCVQRIGPAKRGHAGVAVPPFDGGGSGSIRKLGEQNLVGSVEIKHKQQEGDYQKFEKSRGLVVYRPSEIESSAKNLSRRVAKDGDIYGVQQGKEILKKTQRWVSYGGCIPSILQALASISSIDEALEPWQDSLSNKERSIILKEQTNWERALEIFQWFKQKGCYELNVIHYNIVLRILGKARRWEEIKSIWAEMTEKKIMPTNSTYGTLIDVYSKGGLKEEALLWLEKMNKQGLHPDEVTMGIVVQTYKKAGEFDKAERFFKEWSSADAVSDRNVSKKNSRPQPQKCYSSYTYNTLIDTYGKAGQLREASETFARMLGEGIVPNTVTFNTMMHICGNHGHLKEVESLMMKMEELRCPPDTRTFNILISLYAKNDDIKRAANCFEKMKVCGLDPDPVGYRTLLYAFSVRNMVEEAEALVLEMDERGLEIDESTQTALIRMYIDAGWLEESWLWFERFHLVGTMSPECYSANIDAFGERGHVSLAERAFNCCLNRQNLSVLEFNVMIKAYGVAKEYGKACQLFDQMEKYGIYPDKCTYNSLVQILSRAELPYQAKNYVRKMQEAGYVQDCIPFCAVISSFTKLGELSMAVELFKDMVGFGVQPDIVVFGILINAFAEAGSAKEAMDYVKAMKAAGFDGNSIIHNSLIKLYTKVGYVQEAQDTFQMLQMSQEGPDVYSSNCMIHLYCEYSMIRCAEEIFSDLKKRGQANEFSYSKMLLMYKKNGRFSEAVDVAHEMNKLGLLTDLLSYNNGIGLFVLDGRLKEAAELFLQMISLGVQPDDSTFRSLATALVKCGVSKKAVNKLQIARRRDSQIGIQEWVATLCSVMCVIDGATNSSGQTKCSSEVELR